MEHRKMIIFMIIFRNSPVQMNFTSTTDVHSKTKRIKVLCKLEPKLPLRRVSIREIYTRSFSSFQPTGPFSGWSSEIMNFYVSDKGHS